MSEGNQQKTYFGEGKYVTFHEWDGVEDGRVRLKHEFLIRPRRRAPGHYPYPDLEQSEYKATVTAQQQRLLFPRYESTRHQVLGDSRVAACATTHVTETTNYFNIGGPLVRKRLVDEMGKVPNRALIGSVSGFWSEQVVRKVRELAGEESGIVWEIAKDLSNRDAWEIERFLDDVGREPGKDRVAWAGFLEVYTMTRFSVAPAVDTRRLRYKVFACGRCAALMAAGPSDGSTARDGRVLAVTPPTPWQQRRLCVGDRLAGMQLSANAVSVCQGMALVVHHSFSKKIC